MKTYFTKDSYDTPADTPRCLGDKIFLKTRWWFYVLFLRIVFYCRKLAVKGIYDDEAWVRTSLMVFKTIEKCGGRFRIRGIDNLRKNTDKPIVIVSNHMSTLETIIFPCIIASIRPVTFVVKDNLVKQRVFGPIMRSRDPIVVGRQSPKEDLIKVFKEGQEILENGRSLIIFPQSTRHVELIPEKFNSLGAKLARRAGARMLPTAIKTDFWGNSKISFLKDLGPISREKTIYITFGEPMEIKGNGKEEHRLTLEFIKSHLKKFREPARRKEL
jgi:1-acyl-sn-glycerol-3-phosphate acyltransferase